MDMSSLIDTIHTTQLYCNYMPGVVSLRPVGRGEVSIIDGSRHEDVLHPRVGNVAHVCRLVPANVGETSDDFTAIWAFRAELKNTQHSGA